jgi:hypothetical protein
MTDSTVTRLLGELKQRRDELRPLVDELSQIESAIAALEPVGASPRGGARRGRAGNGRRGPRSGGQGTRPRRGRPPKGEPTRSDQFLALVEQQPGIGIGEAAQQLAIEPNYLYRVSATLQREGTIRKDGRGFVLAVAPSPPSAGAEVIEVPSGEGEGPG